MPDLSKLIVRDAAEADLPMLQALHKEAFGGDAEARLVAGLMANCDSLVSVVAVLEDRIIGHILFSPVTIKPDTRQYIVGLGPMAVRPALQRSGIGSRLVEAGLGRCRQQGVSAVVVLGHKDYYPRFGFRPAADFDLGCTYDVPADVFMALELQSAALQDVTGVVHYHAQFDEL